MAYLAMARKWRPRNFEEMVGQDHIAQTIRNAIGGKRISHGYLFTGTRGVGKTTSARILAKALNCKGGPTATPCETCENCKAVNAGNSMDVLEIDAASNTGVDNIRDLREQVKYAPMQGTYKIYIVDEVHMLTKNAFNALLKTLEEPPAHVVFIFATTEVNKVPQTILSRVQRFDFKRISETRIRERLEFICSQEDIHPERQALEALARKADGSMRDALSLFDQVYAFSGADLTLEAVRKVLGLPREQLFDGLLRALAAHDQKACFDLFQESHREGVETGDLLVAFGEYLRNLLFAAQGVSPGVLGLSDARHAELAACARELGLRDGDILRYAKIVSDLLAGLKNASNPALAVELGLARMASLDRVVTLTQLIGGELPSLPAADEVKKKSPEPLTAAAPPAPAPAPARPLPPPEPLPSFDPPPPAASDFAVDAAEPSPPSPPSPPSRREPSPHAAEPSPAAMGPGPEASSFPAAQGAVAVLTAPPPPAAADREEDRALSFAGLSSLEDDLEPAEPDAPPDDEEEIMSAPRIAGAPTAPSSQAAPEEAEAVPAQDGPGRLPALWPRLVGELMASRPILASHLRRSRLDWDGGAVLKLVFLERAGHALIAEDPDFRKSIQAFLGSKIRGAAEFQLKYHLDEEAANANAEGRSQAAALDEASGEEPIIAFVRQLFEGRTVG